MNVALTHKLLILLSLLTLLLRLFSLFTQFARIKKNSLMLQHPTILQVNDKKQRNVILNMSFSISCLIILKFARCRLVFQFFSRFVLYPNPRMVERGEFFFAINVSTRFCVSCDHFTI